MNESKKIATSHEAQSPGWLRKTALAHAAYDVLRVWRCTLWRFRGSGDIATWTGDRRVTSLLARACARLRFVSHVGMRVETIRVLASERWRDHMLHTTYWSGVGVVLGCGVSRSSALCHCLCLASAGAGKAKQGARAVGATAPAV